MKSKTTVTKGNNPKRSWHLVDLSGQTLGRAATEIAQLIIGKGKPDFSYNADQGDYVVAINASEIEVTGNKMKTKMYHHYTGYAGNLRSFTLAEMMAKDPRKVIMHAVEGMVPKNRLRKQRMTRLKVFVGPDHKYADKFRK
ncbi:MAG: 50S ribosomal protein L13 [Patescibacteria group bacterium]|jgi:large subunit ribosomal protein L13